MGSIFETTMLICFGLSWPLNLAKAYRAKTTKGTSLPFILLITFGYVAGITAKIMNGQINYVLAAYILNIAIVMLNIAVYFRNLALDRRNETNGENTETDRKLTADFNVLEDIEMKLDRNELSNYHMLNELTTGNGIVIMGGTADREIPVSELKQAFSLTENIFNRSLSHLTIADARIAFDGCAAELNPEAMLLHIGDEDLDTFEAKTFESDYRALISHIRDYAPKCRIAMITVANPDKNDLIAEMNRSIRHIAESERCEFCDINAMLWTPKETNELINFIYDTGFESPLTIKRPVYSLVRMLFSYQRVNKPVLADISSVTAKDTAKKNASQHIA